MVLSILQPSFIPWIGYFDIIRKSDLVIFLDHVQFNKRSWQQRNCIKTSEGSIFLTVPVLTKGKFNQRINEVKIDKSKDFINNHLKSIYQNYCKSKYFERYFDKIKNIYEKQENLLINLNMSFILMIMKEIFNNKLKFELSSKLNLKSKKSNLILDICKYYKTKKYLSAKGSENYLIKNDFKKENIDLVFNEFSHPLYNQLNGKFIENLSIIDLLLNCGPESKIIMNNVKSS
tara:strand:+ start:5699 stop:6394 length:696 start_codon:yes stop_codon:yes gene_type:complete